MLASMNLLKSLNAKTEVREMLLVDCATKRGTMGHQLKKLRAQRKGGFWGTISMLTLSLAFYLRSLMGDHGLSSSPVSYQLAVSLGMFAYYWEASDRKIQLLLLIKHYREED
jgi:hypothetical protein